MGQHEFLPGDRVRVTKKGTPKGYALGARGSVVWVSEPGAQHPAYCVVRMDEDEDDPKKKPVVYLGDEIEPDL